MILLVGWLVVVILLLFVSISVYLFTDKNKINEASY